MNIYQILFLIILLLISFICFYIAALLEISRREKEHKKLVQDIANELEKRQKEKEQNNIQQ